MGEIQHFFVCAKFRHLATKIKGLQILQYVFCKKNKKLQYFEKGKGKLNLPDLDHSF
jgi:hypothetical protein